MNTTIIILGALILIVIIAIVVVLIKGKGPKEDSKETDSGMTFKDDSAPQEVPQDIPEPQSQIVTPQLHQVADTPTPVQNPPVLNDLNTPMDTQNNTSNLNIDDSTSPINQPNALPDETQMQNDMANLDDSMNQPNTAPDIPASETTQDSSIEDVANTINQKVVESPEEIMPTVGTSDEVSVAEEGLTPMQDETVATPMEEVTTPIDLDTTPIPITDMDKTAQPISSTTVDVSEETSPIPEEIPSTMNQFTDTTPVPQPTSTIADTSLNTDNNIPPITPQPPVTPM